MEGTLTAKPNSKKKFLTGTTIFIFVMLFYPVGHFLLMWFGVNINSILLTFQWPVRGKLEFLALNELFFNYETLFLSFKMESTQSMFLASLAYFVISCLVTLPISLFFSYFIFKKIRGNGFFKIIFFIPSILPLIILTIVYRYGIFSNQGILSPMLNALNINVANLFIDQGARWMVWLFCIWAGIGYNVILLTAGMSRVPREILESCKMDGVKPMREFFKVIIPLTWPTITTLFILGMMSVFNVFMQPMFITQGQYDTMTIGLHIYQASGGAGLNEPATLGLFCSIIGAPIILLVRHLLNKAYGDVEF
ncbi:sugar ABC transporter permease [Trichlorobacter sp.]|jgi:ABC-type sugar transport system permease subunit|uniref:carbohydrate ABC transporter permease n=1 Tax=Trichlorobacter sp. TaxID=2911007 RepID=UPI002A365EFE|nr:sugar ABC transporter permease [Trichlorobacter sp.]MDY0385461.1 sugar ABC transporter permease [Trichlorobacter sp.]